MYMIMLALVSSEIGYLGYQSYSFYKHNRAVNKFGIKIEQLNTERQQHTKEFELLKGENK